MFLGFIESAIVVRLSDDGDCKLFHWDSSFFTGNELVSLGSVDKFHSSKIQQLNCQNCHKVPFQCRTKAKYAHLACFFTNVGSLAG